jgi:hypothetical protein
MACVKRKKTVKRGKWSQEYKVKLSVSPLKRKKKGGWNYPIKRKYYHEGKRSFKTLSEANAFASNKRKSRDPKYIVNVITRRLSSKPYSVYYEPIS